jgi:hypothetical protein
MKLDVLLAAASAGPVAYRLHELDLLGVASASSVEALSSPKFWIAAGCLGMLYVFHASIWFYPKRWISLSATSPLSLLGSDPVQVRCESI